jgi:hypothetical protein
VQLRRSDASSRALTLERSCRSAASSRTRGARRSASLDLERAAALRRHRVTRQPDFWEQFRLITMECNNLECVVVEPFLVHRLDAWGYSDLAIGPWQLPLRVIRDRVSDSPFRSRSEQSGHGWTCRWFQQSLAWQVRCFSVRARSAIGRQVRRSGTRIRMGLLKSPSIKVARTATSVSRLAAQSRWPCDRLARPGET